MTSHAVSVRVLLCTAALLLAGALHGCSVTEEWYGLDEQQSSVRDSLFTLRVTPDAGAVAVHMSLRNPLMEVLRNPDVRHDSVDGATWVAALQQHGRNVEQFYRTRCTVGVQFCGDSLWLHRPSSELSSTHNGDAWYTFTCAEFEHRAEEHDSIRVVVAIDTAAAVAGSAPYRREYILGRYSRTRWQNSLRLAH